MPVDDRKINSAVRMAGTVDGKKYTKGQVITDPDDLANLAAKKDSGVDLQKLHDAGVISGTWKGVKAK